MPLTDYHDMVQTFPSTRANHALGIGVLPRRSWRCDRLPDVQHPGLTRKSFAIDLVPIPDQIPRAVLRPARLDQLSPVHSAVGCSVILKCRSRRRPWLNTTSTNSTRKVAVGTVKKSNAIRSWAWFFRNVRHTCDGGLRCRGMYFETVACETVRPSFSSSPWIRGAPQRGLARLIRPMRSRTSVPIAGRPRRCRLFPAQ